MSSINRKPFTKVTELDERDYQIIFSLAHNNMRATETAYDLCVHRGTILYRIEKIKKITGLDAMKFYDLVNLVDIANNKTKGDSNDST